MNGSSFPNFFSELGLMVTLVASQVPAKQAERIFRLPFSAIHALLEVIEMKLVRSADPAFNLPEFMMSGS